MQDVKTLTVSDLLRHGRSHTGSSTPIPPAISDQTPQPPRGPFTSKPNRDFKPLPQLDYPAIIVGTLILPTLTLKCPHRNCLEFSDGSVAVCCDFVGFDPRAIGKKINVLTWNFITSDSLSSGFLEIVEWDLSDSSHALSRCSRLIIDSFPIFSNLVECVAKTSKAKSHRIHGIIGAVSPVSNVPCPFEESSSNKSMNLRGFQVRLMTCECDKCRSQESVRVLYEAKDSHSFTAPVLVYFCGPAWCWHPVLTKLIGKVVTISGLTKKLILVGKEESFLMLVAVNNTILHLQRSLKKRKVVCGYYKGTVTNVYMQGMVVELDEEAWLLLTNQSLMPSHGLRIGAVISIRNVHFVAPQFSWAKFPVLGACFNTSIIVKSFSPLETRCLTLSHSQSRLGNFIEALGFSTRLWVLLLVSCFQKIFSCILSRKELLGSRDNEGLVQKFARSHLPPSVFRARHGVLKEFSKHESLCTVTEPYPGNLILVVPVSCFIHECETFWIKALLPLDNILPVSCVGKYYQRSKRKVFRSEDLGIVLVGMLKISPTSGRLYLVDMTGSIDVVIPDLPYFWDPDCIFQVVDYFLIVEGMHELDRPELSSDDSSLPRSIFRGFQSARRPNLKIFVYFHLRNATCRNRPIYPSIVTEDQLNDTKSGNFHLIYITRKVRPTGHSMKSERTVFVEAIVIPWYLFLAGKDGSIHQDKVLIDCTVGNHADHSSSKRQKIDRASTLSGTCFKDNFCSVCFEKGTSIRETCGDQSCLRTSFSHEIPCSATIKGVNNFIFTSSGTLYRIKANAKIKVCEGRARKCFLAFASECDWKYQIGGVYLMKHHKEGPLCNIKSASLKDVTIPITSGTYLRRLSFSSEDLTTDKSLHNSSLCNEVFGKDQVLAVANCSSISDIHLHVPSSFTGLFESDIKELGNDQNASDANPGSFCPSLVMKTSMNADLIFDSGLLGHSHIFPTRKFTSLCGDIIAVHGFDQGSDDMCSSLGGYGDHLQYGSCDRTKNFCIHVSVPDQTVKIFGFVNQYLFPTGFGPGINATFHQIFDLRPRVPSTLMLKSESSIVINSIKAVDETHISDANLKRLRCRVVAVYVLVLEKRNRKCDGLNSNMQSRPLNVDIPLACFILDDGSSSWCCWANAERAATLLRLKENQRSGRKASGYKRRRVGVQSTATASTMHGLERILEKHDRITVKSSRSVSDPLDQDFSVTAGSGRALVGLNDDLDLVASVIFNASINTFWTVVTEVMDSNAVNLLKEHMVEMQMPMPSMENLWAREVCRVDQLTEAREMMQKNL